MTTSTSTALANPTSPVLIASSGGRFKSKFRMYFGRVELTAERLTYYEKSAVWLMFGALGMLLSRFAAGKRHTELELGRIAGVARGKHGFNKKILDIKTSDGASHRFMVDQFDAFIAALDEQLVRRGLPRVAPLP
jgi:hypothetical protein